MQKKDFITYLNDEDIGKEIYEIIRRGGRPTGTAYTQSAEWFAAKAEFLVFLQDSDICKAIFEVIKRGLNTNKPTTPPVTTVTTSKPYQEAIAAREQARAKITGQKISTANPQPPAEEKKPETPPVDRKATLGAKLQFLKDKVEALEAFELANATAEAAAGETKFTLVVEKNCPVCGRKTRVVQSKTRLVADKQDVDLCMHYKDFNPYLYSVWVCENCGYTADDVRFQERMADRVRKQIKMFLAKNDFKIPFADIRDKDEALTLYEMAIYFNKMFEHSKGRQGLLYQKMAWICRIENDNEKEREYLRKSAELFEVSVLNERYPIGKLTDDTATYIIGVNYYMLGELDKAAKFLSNIITNSSIRASSPKLYEKARDLWQDIRQARK